MSAIEVRDGDIDAGISGIDPAAQEEIGIGPPSRGAEVHDEIVRLHDALVLRGCEVRDEHVVALAQRGQRVVSTFIDGAERGLAVRHLEEAQLHRAGRNKAFVDEHVHRIRVVHGEQLDLIRIRCFPEFLRELEEVASVAGLERIARNTEVFL